LISARNIKYISVELFVEGAQPESDEDTAASLMP